MPRRVVYLAAAFALASCTQRLYEGAPRSPERVALINVGSVIVRGIDGKPRRGGAFDAAVFELTPGTHRLTLVFELPARSIGLKTIPAQTGVGTCELVIATKAGKQYYLGARPLGEPMSTRWSGQWEAWARDPSSVDEDDIIARCSAQPAAGEPTPRGWIAVASPTVAPVAAAPAAPEAAPAEPPAAAPAVVAPRPPAAPAAPAAPPVVAAPAPTPGAVVEFVRLGTWNLRSFDGAAQRDVARMAQVIEQHFDVLTLTEIVATPNGPLGYQRLLSQLGDGWRGMVTAAPAPAPGAPAEHYAIVYRRDRVRPCPGWDAMRVVPDGGAFVRPPAFACFEAGDLAEPGVDFLLAAYRATWADGDAGMVAIEVARTNEVFAAMRAAKPDEKDLIIAGDFNLGTDELAQVLSAADRTAGDGSRLDMIGNRTESLSDHLLVDDERATDEVLGNGEALDVRGIAPAQDIYYRTISDHLPVMVQLLTTGPDDD